MHPKLLDVKTSFMIFGSNSDGKISYKLDTPSHKIVSREALSNMWAFDDKKMLTKRTLPIF